MPRNLDEEFGQIPGPSDVDPAHLHALAQSVASLARRIEALAAGLDMVQQSGERRDHKLGQISEQIVHVEDEVDHVRIKLDDLLKASAQFTPEQRAVLEDIIIGVGHKRWLGRRAKLLLQWTAATVAFIATVYAIKDLLKTAFMLFRGSS